MHNRLSRLFGGTVCMYHAVRINHADMRCGPNRTSGAITRYAACPPRSVSTLYQEASCLKRASRSTTRRQICLPAPRSEGLGASFSSCLPFWLFLTEMSLFTHHQHGTVSVPNYGVRDASHQSPPYASSTSASHHDQTGPQLFGQRHDLHVGSAPRPQVSLCYGSRHVLDRSYHILE
jgi:hypothetical protein